jgi:integrase
VSPLLLDELKSHKAGASSAESDDLPFPTRNGTQRDRSNVRARVLAPTITRANKKARTAGKPEIQPGVTNHTMRRTFASLLYESGASPAYEMAQMGHESAALALEVYSKVMERKRDTGERMDALVQALIGHEWGQTARTRKERLLLRQPMVATSSVFRVGGTGIEPVTSCL